GRVALREAWRRRGREEGSRLPSGQLHGLVAHRSTRATQHHHRRAPQGLLRRDDMAITNGKYIGRVFGQTVLGNSSNKGTPFIQFYGKITQGPEAGGKARYTGYFGPNSAERTIESIQLCGWEGDDVGEFADGELHGLDTNEVEFVIELEEYETE